MINLNRNVRATACQCGSCEKSKSPKLLTPKQAGEYLQVASATLEKWRMKNIGPKFAKFANRTIRYNIEELEKFVLSSTITPNAEKN